MEPAAHPSPCARGAASGQSRPSALGSAIAADLEALRNDFALARELAAEYQQQLAGKSNELAGLKQMFEKTQLDLDHLRSTIAELREERHRLANEAMLAVAYQTKWQRAVGERDRLTQELADLRRSHEEENRRRQALAERERATARVSASAESSASSRLPDDQSREFIEISFHDSPVISLLPCPVTASDTPAPRARCKRA